MSEELTPMNNTERWLKAIATGTVPESLETMTHEELWLKQIAQGGSGLPPVTASDNGKVLTVADGAWGAQEPIGKKFIVTLTPTSADYSGTMDKTQGEIGVAYEAGMDIVFRFAYGATHFDLPGSMEVDTTEGTVYKFHAFIVLAEEIVEVYTDSAEMSNATYQTGIYALTPAT